MFANLGSGEIIVIILVLLFLFGGKKLPELARGLGESSKEINKVKTELSSALSDITSVGKDEEDDSDEKKRGGDAGNA